MLNNSDYIIVFVTVSDEKEAEKIAMEILENRLAACCNILPSVKSFFRWKGEIETENELLLIFKTRQDRFGDLKTLISSLHSYEIPEIIAIPIIQGNEQYLKWIDQETD